jgi:uncharacterized Rmd1/YagE family protein
LPELSEKLSTTDDFEIASDSTSSSNMIHIIDKTHGGDIYLFSNGTFACWGLDQSQLDTFLEYIHFGNKNEEHKLKFIEAKENVEYTIDEDE